MDSNVYGSHRERGGLLVLLNGGRTRLFPGNSFSDAAQLRAACHSKEDLAEAEEVKDTEPAAFPTQDEILDSTGALASFSKLHIEPKDDIPSELFRSRVGELDRRFHEALEMHRALNDALNEVDMLHADAQNYRPCNELHANTIEEKISIKTDTAKAHRQAAPSKKSSKEPVQRTKSGVVVVKAPSAPVPYFKPLPRPKVFSQSPARTHHSQRVDEDHRGFSVERRTSISREGSLVPRQPSIRRSASVRSSSVASDYSFRFEEPVLEREESRLTIPNTQPSESRRVSVTFGPVRLEDIQYASTEESVSESLSSQSGSRTGAIAEVVQQFQNLCRAAAGVLLNRGEVGETTPALTQQDRATLEKIQVAPVTTDIRSEDVERWRQATKMLQEELALLERKRRERREVKLLATKAAALVKAQSLVQRGRSLRQAFDIVEEEFGQDIRPTSRSSSVSESVSAEPIEEEMDREPAASTTEADGTRVTDEEYEESGSHLAQGDDDKAAEDEALLALLARVYKAEQHEPEAQKATSSMVVEESLGSSISPIKPSIPRTSTVAEEAPPATAVVRDGEEPQSAEGHDSKPHFIESESVLSFLEDDEAAHEAPDEQFAEEIEQHRSESVTVSTDQNVRRHAGVAPKKHRGREFVSKPMKEEIVDTGSWADFESVDAKSTQHTTTANTTATTTSTNQEKQRVERRPVQRLHDLWGPDAQQARYEMTKYSGIVPFKMFYDPYASSPTDVSGYSSGEMQFRVLSGAGFPFPRQNPQLSDEYEQPVLRDAMNRIENEDVRISDDEELDVAQAVEADGELPPLPMLKESSSSSDLSSHATGDVGLLGRESKTSSLEKSGSDKPAQMKKTPSASSSDSGKEDVEYKSPNSALLSRHASTCQSMAELKEKIDHAMANQKIMQQPDECIPSEPPTTVEEEMLAMECWKRRRIEALRETFNPQDLLPENADFNAALAQAQRNKEFLWARLDALTAQSIPQRVVDSEDDDSSSSYEDTSSTTTVATTDSSEEL